LSRILYDIGDEEQVLLLTLEALDANLLPVMAKSLTDIVAQSAAFQDALRPLKEESSLRVSGSPVIFDRVATSSFAFVAALVADFSAKELPDLRRRIWLVADALPLQERLAAEFPLWSSIATIFIPEQELHVNNGLSDPDLAAERLSALRRLSARPSAIELIFVTSAGLRQFAPLFNEKKDCAIALKVSNEYCLENLTGRFVEADFDRVDQVVARGQWSSRGGIIDIFPLQSTWPFRLEFFGDVLESIRAFDVDSQLSIKKLSSADLVLDEPPADKRLADWIAPSDWVITCPGAGVAGDVLLYECPPDAIPLPHFLEDANSEHSEDALSKNEAAEQAESQSSDAEKSESLEQLLAPNAESDTLAIFASPLGIFDSGDFVMQEARRALATLSLLRWKAEGWRVWMYFPHASEKRRFEEICGEDSAWSGVQHRDGDLPIGFSIPSAKVAILSAAEIFGRYTSPHARKQANREERLRCERAQAPLREVLPGDLVIHASHGLGRFVGIVRDDEKGDEEIHIEYAGDILLRVPLSQSYLVSKYIGMGGKTPELSRLGDARWQRACKSAERAVADYAAQLLEVQAERENNTGYAHPADSTWMWQFESSFPYRETPDQMRAIKQSKADMESKRPMDRLICGDVGFGKTEVAIRAAFKCVTGGKQVAILAPTTILADQHTRTFRQRMSEYPIRIEMLSRFTTAKKAREVIAGLADGSVDIVIGTHRLTSKDVSFSNLGLVVIDEEQRFGVRQKEMFKRNFRMVDMLTLSATPIPRTLYVALMGARDMSTIETAPANRYPVQTTVCPYDEQLIKRAIERELARGGQCFFLHNRVSSIRTMQAKLKKLVPHARIVVGHGQMDKSELESVMHDFVSGQADVLLSTTIIESGIDIPNANTMIIDRADRFGLADLYQLRGRVGRGVHRAYAYLLLPREAICTGDARKRVNAIKQYTELGSGFKIAMRDLEIRGAGNLLGTQQSGHIAAIGFELYCQLLRQSIEHMQGKVPALRADCLVRCDFLCLSEALHQQQDKKLIIGAYIPSSYMESSRMRMSAYTQLAKANSMKDVEELESQWKDRFGKAPAEIRHLMMLQQMKILASRSRLSQVEIRGQKLMMMRNGDYLLMEKRFPRLTTIRPLHKFKEAITLLELL